MSSVKIFLVGGPDAVKNNSWEAMTNSWAEAEQLKKEIGPTAVHKVVTVGGPKRRK